MIFHDDHYLMNLGNGVQTISVVEFEWSKKRSFYEEDCSQVWEDEPVIDMESLRIFDIRDQETGNLILEEPFRSHVLELIAEDIQLMDIEELEDCSSDEEYYYEEVF